MHHIKLLPVIIFLHGATVLHAQDTLGDIKYSMLEPTLFKQLHPGWVLADGEDIKGSQLAALTGMQKAPDARGLFLRGMNVSRQTDSGDAQGNRAVASYQSDDIKRHSHLIGGPATT